MKKFLFAAVVAAILGLTSCGEKESCYVITTSTGAFSSAVYFWGTQNDVEAAIDAEKQDYVSMVTSAKVNKSEKECSGVAY